MSMAYYDENDPQIIEARELLAEMPSTHLIETDERKRLRKKIAAELYGDGSRHKGARSFIILGPPAAGKSTFANPIVEQFGALLIDADVAKERLPEYEELNGGIYAGALHKESSDIKDAVLEQAVEARDDFVYPAVGKTYEYIHELCRLLTDLDYHVKLILVDCDVATSVTRAVQRFKKYGRFVDPDYIVNRVDNLPRQTYDRMKEEGICEYEEHETNEKT